MTVDRNYRDAGSGEYVSPTDARQHPDSTVSEPRTEPATLDDVVRELRKVVRLLEASDEAAKRATSAVRKLSSKHR